jgi:hypothetical protein
MDLAYVARDGRIERPPVAAVDLGDGKGRCLIASRFISKGDIIYTERALVGAQIPDLCATCNAGKEEFRTAYRVRACQHCLCSLEPGSCLIPPSANVSDDSPTSLPPTIPLAHLWPVVEYQDCKDTAPRTRAVEPFQKILEDTVSRRVTCERCYTPFCSKYCAKSYVAATGDCCHANDAINGAIHGLVCSQDVDNDHQVNTTINIIDPVYALSTRMFCMLVQRHRSGNSLTLFDELCGVADDVTPLRLGDYSNDTDGYSLINGYRLVSEALSLSEDERHGPLSLMTFHKLSAKAQRNGILLTTKSPFREYYGAVLRNTGGRGSARQQVVVSEIARVLGSPDGKLSRDMDGLVEKKVGQRGPVWLE